MDEPGLDARLGRLETRLDEIAARLDRLLGVGQWGHDLAEVMELHMHRVLATSGVKSSLRSLTLTELRRRLGADDVATSELKLFSQNGEDGVLAQLLGRVGVGERYFVEFGAGDGKEGNCVLLADVLGWRGLFMEADPDQYERLALKYANNDRVSTRRATVRAEDVEQHFLTAGVPAEPDILSVDVDGDDYWIWRAITAYRPRIVVIEYNASLDRTEPLVQAPGQGPWDGTEYFGASVAALSELGTAKGYTLVHAELSGSNLFFVRADLGDGWPEPVLRSPNYYVEGYRHPPARGDRSYLRVDPPAAP